MAQQQPSLRVLSLGAGVQSTTLALIPTSSTCTPGYHLDEVDLSTAMVTTSGYQHRGRLMDMIEHWPLDRLLPYAANARTHSDDQVAQIAGSIAAFGFNVPCLVDERGVLIAGHGRLLAARQPGAGDSAGNPVGTSERGGRASVPHRRQPNRRERRLG